MTFLKLLVSLLLIVAVAVGVTVYLKSSARKEDETAARERAEKGFLTTRQQLNDKLEDIRQRREEVVVQIGRLDERKQEAAGKLKEMGVSNANDLENNARAKLEFANVKRVMADVEKFKEDLTVYDDAIVRIEAALDDLDRQEYQRNAGINEQQSRQLETIVRDLDDRLLRKESALEELRTQEVLDEILSADDAK